MLFVTRGAMIWITLAYLHILTLAMLTWIACHPLVHVQSLVAWLQDRNEWNDRPSSTWHTGDISHVLNSSQDLFLLTSLHGSAWFVSATAKGGKWCFGTSLEHELGYTSKTDEGRITRHGFLYVKYYVGRKGHDPKNLGNMSPSMAAATPGKLLPSSSLRFWRERWRTIAVICTEHSCTAINCIHEKRRAANTAHVDTTWDQKRSGQGCF